MRGGDEYGYTLYTFNLVKSKITKYFFLNIETDIKDCCWLVCEFMELELMDFFFLKDATSIISVFQFF